EPIARIALRLLFLYCDYWYRDSPLDQSTGLAAALSRRTAATMWWSRPTCRAMARRERVGSAACSRRASRFSGSVSADPPLPCLRLTWANGGNVMRRVYREFTRHPGPA